MDTFADDIHNQKDPGSLYNYLHELKNLSACQSHPWRQPRYWITFNRDYSNCNGNSNYLHHQRHNQHYPSSSSSSPPPTPSAHHLHTNITTSSRRGRNNSTVTPQVNNTGHNSSNIVRYSARKRREALGKECFCGWALAVLALDVPKKLFSDATTAPGTTASANATNGKEVLTISLWMNLVPGADTSSSSDHGSVTIKSHVNHKTIRSTSFPTGCKVTVKPIAPDEIHLFSLAHGNVALEIWLNLKRDRLKFRLLCTKYWLVLGEAEEAADLFNGESINHASNGSRTSSASKNQSASSPFSKSTFNFTSPIKSSFTCLRSEKWHHLTVTVAFGKQGRKEGLLSISVILNGFNRSLTNIENFNDEFNPVTSKSDVLLLLGTTCLPDQISSLQLTSLKLLADKLTQMDCIFLYLLGPNHENLTTNWNEKFDIETFKIPIELPNIDIETCYNLVDIFTNEEYQSKFYTKLTSNCLIEFPILKRDYNHSTANEPHFNVTSSLKCLLYTPKVDPLHIASVSNVLILSFFEPSQRSCVLGDESDFHFKLNDSISVESLLFLTGKLLESNYSSPANQSEILTIFFKIVLCNSQFYKSFVNLKGYAMVNEMLKGVRFNNPKEILNVYIDHCTLVTESNCNLLLRCTSALVHCFKCWKIWHSNSDSISLLYNKLLALLDQSNIWYKINVFIIQQSTLLDEILFMLQVSFEKNILPNVTFNGTHVSLLKQIIGKIISTPPNLDLLRKLVNCLLLLHDSNRLYVCQSRQSFYFLIPQQLLLTKASSEENCSTDSPSDSGVNSNDTWHVIRTANDIATHETIHTLIFTGLLRCLTKILGDLPPGQLESVLGPIIKIEYLLVWANVENATVREVVLRTLTTCLRKGSANFFIRDFNSKGGFQILSNQLSQFKLTCETISILSNFILDTEAIDLASNDEWVHSRNWARLTSIQASAFTCIMSQILKSVDETSTCHWSLLIFTRLLSCIPLSSPVLEYLIDHGIVNFCANVIYQTTQLLANGNATGTGDQVKCPDILLDQDVILKDINGILEIIAYKLISSTGNVFFEAYDSSLNLFIVLSKSTSADTNAFRDGLISLLKGAFDAIEKYSSLLSDKSSFRGE